MGSINITECPVCGGSQFSDFLTCTDHFVSGEEFVIRKCEGCGFKLTADAPDEDSISPYYQSEEYVSHSDTSKGLVNRAYHVARNIMLGQKRKITARAARIKSGKLLDIGAGTGYFASYMEKHGWQVAGTEKSGEARQFAHNEFGLELHPTEQLFSFSAESFDIVTMWHVLEHIHALKKNISELNRVLKPNGCLFIAIPNHTSYDAKHYKKFWAAYDVPRHIWHFAPPQLQALFEKSGFRLIKKYRLPLDSFYISIVSEKYKKSSLPFLKGVWHGKISWLESLMNRNRCSSVIYALRKN